MLFHSHLFLFVFLPLTIAAYGLASRRGETPALLTLVVASLLFYGWWEPVYLVLLTGSIAFNFFMGARLQARPSTPLLTLGVAANLALLGWFKYAGFFADIAAGLTGASLGVAHMALPLGISFITFQKIAYLVDCNQGKVRAYTLAEFGLFVTFFPQLVAGPIVHHSDIVPQVRANPVGLRADNVAIGLTIFILGLFKKVIIAERMAAYANPMFDGAAAGETITFLEAWAGALAYTLQLYFDFSGYSDMAIGLGRIFNIRLPLNFHSPYKAVGIIEFWRRWHMTLSRFLRDYLYVPLGGNRLGPTRRRVNLMAVMLLGGLWHGAGWTFVIWGGLHGLYLVVNHLWRGLGWSLPRPLAWGLTFLAVVVAWVFFRAADLEAALNILAAMALMPGRVVVTIGWTPVFNHLVWLVGPVQVAERPLLYFAGMSQMLWTAAILAAALVLPNTQQWMHRFEPCLDEFRPARWLPPSLAWRPCRRWAAVVIALACAAVIGAMQPTQFLYWQF